MSTVMIAKTGDPPDAERTRPGSQKSGGLSVEQVITRLFPPPTVGQQFYRHFLERAARETTLLPDEPPDTVAICTQSIATLATEMGMGGDTTQKYVVIYRALGLLKKRKMMGSLVFVLRTGIYHPPDGLEANLLHILQKSRRKLHEMAADVLARCKIYGLVDQDFQAAVSTLNDLLHAEPGETRRTLAQRLLHAQYAFSLVLGAVENRSTPHSQADSASRFDHHPPRSAAWVDSDLTQADPPLVVQSSFENERAADNRLSVSSQGDSLHPQPAKESPRTPTQGRFLEEPSDARPPQGPDGVDSLERTPAPSLTESTSTPSLGRFACSCQRTHLPESTPQGDSSSPIGHPESSNSCQIGRFDEQAAVKNIPVPPNQGDSSSPVCHPESAHSSQAGRFDGQTAAENLPVTLEQGDSSAGNNVYVNVITFIQSVTLNVRPVAAFCCHALGEPPSKQPIYLKLFRECERDAEAIASALLFTLAHQKDGTIRNPASVFITRCRDYHAHGVPDEAVALVRQYGTLTYTRLQEALSSSASPSDSPRAPASTGEMSALATPSSLPSLPRWGTVPRLIAADPEKSGMSREEALRVIKRARGDRRIALCRVDLEHLADGSYAVLLDNTITAIPRQTYIYSCSEWEARTATIEDCFELFGVKRTDRRSLADRLKGRRHQQ